MKHFTKILATVSLTSFLFAQGETLAVGGNVTDFTTGKPIVGANVIVDETSISTTTDSNGSYDEIGMKRLDLVILKFRYDQLLSMASKESIWKDDEDILEEEIIPIKVDDGEYGPGSVTILLNGNGLDGIGECGKRIGEYLSMSDRLVEL